MFGKKKQPPIKSLIAAGSRIQGDMHFTDGLRIDGEVTGNICAVEGGLSILVISETACVTGRVQADHVVINGRVVGPVHALELLELQPKARIEGEVHYKSLEMHQGATISGQLRPSTVAVLDEKPPLQLTARSTVDSPVDK